MRRGMTERSAPGESVGPSPTVRVEKGPAGHRLVGAALDEANSFLEMLGIRGLSPATVRAYAFDLLLLHRWLAESQRALRTLDQSQLLGFIAHQQRAGAQPASINRRLTTCEQYFSFV